MISPGRRLAVAAVFALAGPPVGGLAYLLYAVGVAAATDPGGLLIGVPLMLMFALPFSYAFGFLPAAATGAAAALLAGVVKRDWQWLAVMTALGALAGGAASLAGAGASTGDLDGHAALIAIGALAALACAFWTRRLRRGRAAAPVAA